MHSQNMRHIMTQQTKDSWLLPWMLSRLVFWVAGNKFHITWSMWKLWS